MLSVGCDLHKKTITVCVMNQSREIVCRKRLYCDDEAGIRAFFEGLGPYQFVVEATASYEWFVRLLEPSAHRALLAHPKKLRVIAESTRKSDKLDAQVLAEFLALDMIPTSYRPTPRQREHRRLVRHRDGIQKRITSVKNRIRRILADENADFEGLFTVSGLQKLKAIPLSDADRFAVDQMLEEYELYRRQLKQADERLVAFAESAPSVERERRALLRSIPGVGFVTSEVVLAELADIGRFASAKRVTSYAGLSPGKRSSAGKSLELHLEKNGSGLLRQILVESAWQLVRYSARWKGYYERLKVRLKAKKAIVAVARRLLCMITAILKSGQPYDPTYQPS
jgi:transposase